MSQIARNEAFPYRQGPQIQSSDRIMIIAPHPDDECLGNGGLIERAVAKNIPILVVMMTNGDGYRRCAELYFKTPHPTPEHFKQLGVIRRTETLNALNELGVKEDAAVFLSYPDGGINSLFNRNWDYDHLYKGHTGMTHAPYSFAYERSASYCGANAAKNLRQLILGFKPSILLYPDTEDDHYDHWATGAFTKYVLAETNYKCIKLAYLVHKGPWPSPWLYAPAKYKLPPPKLSAIYTGWLGLFLSDSEIQTKHAAVHLYRSQRAMMDPFLDAFVRKNELYRTDDSLITEPVSKAPDFLSAEQLPHLIRNDPQDGTLLGEVRRVPDILGLSFAYTKDKAWLALQARQPIKPYLSYGFHMCLFGKGIVQRVDVAVRNGKATNLLSAKDSVKLEDISIQSRTDRLVLEFPKQALDESNQVILSADLFIGPAQVDRTAWQTIEIT